MAASRKLQGEIDRCLKKVTEGVETFEDIWQKVHNATNSNQKEKYEADLKKEIKKLQRLRDQIKSWIASAEIKDKSTLLDYRKLIETQMERFKVVERETKTKAYSKEGLGAVQKMDPAQKEKEEMSNWLVNSIDNLNIQLDQFECEIESLLVGKKKRLDKDKQDRMDELKVKVERHRYHIRKLETLLRMLDNMSIEVDQVLKLNSIHLCSKVRTLNQTQLKQIKGIKEDVEYYIESSQEPDFEENEYIYDDIEGLDELEMAGVIPSSATTDSNGSPNSLNSGSPHSPLMNHCKENDSPLCQSTNNEECLASKGMVKPTALRPVSNSITPPVTSIIPTTPLTTPIKQMSSATPSLMSTPTSNSTSNSISNSSSSNNNNSIATTPPNTKQQISQPSTPLSNHHPPQPSPQLVTSNFATIAATTTPTSMNHPTSLVSPLNYASFNKQLNSSSHHILENGNTPVLTSNTNTSTVTSNNNNNTTTPTATTTSSTSNTTSVTTNNDIGGSSSSPPSSISSAPSPSPLPQTPPPMETNPSTPSTMSLKSIVQNVIDKEGLEVPTTSEVQEAFDKSCVTSEAIIPHMLGVVPLGHQPLNKGHQYQFQAVESAFHHIPQPADSERLRQYVTRTPCSTPAHYPSAPLPGSDTLEFFQRLSTETLFFIFYYMEGTKAQYLAAKVLKKQSWRFHTKYMMWFQRHEEPKLINEDYEQGTYIYFDNEKWSQRKKEGFTFEYKYLEDRELN